MKYPAELVYAAFKIGTITRRFLFCDTKEKPRFGDPSFDFMGFFGFGSGEFNGEVPPEIKHVRVKIVEMDSTDPELTVLSIANKMAEAKQFMGFYTKEGDKFYMLIEDAEGQLLTHLKDLNWHYYTQIGDRGVAVAHLQTLKRRHFLFETLEEQNTKLEKYTVLAATI